MKTLTFGWKNLMSVVIWLTLSTQLSAAIVVSVVPATPTVVKGSSTSVDLFITSDANDALDSFSAEVSIHGGDGLRFAESQSGPHLQDSRYVFFDRSSSALNRFESTTVLSRSQMAITDLTDDGSGAPLPRSLENATWLLGSLDLNAHALGDFTIEVSSTSSFFDLAVDPISFAGGRATVSVTAVPEPSTTLGLIAIAFGFVARRRHLSARPTEACASSRPQVF